MGGGGGGGDGKGLQGAGADKLHPDFRSKPLGFLKIAQPFPQQGWRQGPREARLPFYGKENPDPQREAELEPLILDEAQQWGLGWDRTGWGHVWVGFPGLGPVQSLRKGQRRGWQGPPRKALGSWWMLTAEVWAPRDRCWFCLPAYGREN